MINDIHTCIILDDNATHSNQAKTFVSHQHKLLGQMGPSVVKELREAKIVHAHQLLLVHNIWTGLGGTYTSHTYDMRWMGAYKLLEDWLMRKHALCFIKLAIIIGWSILPFVYHRFTTCIFNLQTITSYINTNLGPFWCAIFGLLTKVFRRTVMCSQGRYAIASFSYRTYSSSLVTPPRLRRPHSTPPSPPSSSSMVS